jgi:hypothetical protein
MSDNSSRQLATITRAVMLAVALLSTSRVQAQEPQERTVPVRWLMDLTFEGGSEKGTSYLPVADPSGTCASKFEITAISFWRVQQKGPSGHPDLRSEIAMTLRKLFAGESPVPEVTILQTIDELTLPVRFAFRGTSVVERESWKMANVEFSETFDALDLSVTQNWNTIQIRCHE